MYHPTDYLLVRFSQQALQTQQHALHIVDRAPFILENIQADPTGKIDIGMVDGCFEEHGRRTVGVIGGEAEGQLEV